MGVPDEGEFEVEMDTLAEYRRRTESLVPTPTIGCVEGPQTSQ